MVKYFRLIAILVPLFMSTNGWAEFELPFYQNELVLDNYVARNAVPLDESKLFANQRVVYIGETHYDTSAKNFMIVNMPEFKKLGFTHIAMEMFQASQQSLLDGYYRGTVSDEKIKDYLKYEWGWISPKYYLNIIKAARKQGIRIVAIDGRESAGEKNVGQEARDNVMTKAIADNLKNPANKMIVFIGSEHINASSLQMIPYQPEVLLRKYGIKSKGYKIQHLNKIIDTSIMKIYSGVDNSRLRHSLTSQNISTNYTYLPLPIEDAGYEGIIFTDMFNRDRFSDLNF